MQGVQRLAAPVGIVFALAALVMLPSGASASHDGETASDVQLIAAATGDDTSKGREEQVAQNWAEEGAETCMECHDEPPVTMILHRPHGQMADSRTPFAGRQCEACHGASPQHLEKPAEGEERTPVTIRFGPDSPNPVSEQNGVCLDCHEGGEQMHWRGSTHQFNDVACASCHNVHAVRDPVRTADNQKDVCFTCHMQVRGQIYQRSHHPIREELLACSDCHNPHGSFAQSMLVKQTVNDTCYECHEEKRGPFLWEHQPVREDCTICHKPHGSTQPKLLQVRAPWLCQQCHSATFHPGTLYDGNAIRTLDEHTIANGCMNCHPKVHGTNHPSGNRLTR